MILVWLGSFAPCLLQQDISKRITKLEEKDLSLDDMDDDSAYTLVERYKAKFVKVWNKLCSLKGRAPSTGRPTERKFHFEGTRLHDQFSDVVYYVLYVQCSDSFNNMTGFAAKVFTAVLYLCSR